MKRRAYLGTIASAGIVSTAGCLDAVPGVGDSQTVLSTPEQDLSAAAHPSHGDELPAVSLPDPLTDTAVSTERFEESRTLLLTFFYTNCPDGMCPALILRLRRAQEVASQEGFSDDAAFLAMTFDPERDTSSVLREYATQHSVNLTAGNWHFLRPEAYETGQDIISTKFGLQIEKRDADQYENIEYTFPHYTLILLVNDQGIVERAYPNGSTVDINRITDDFTTVVSD